MVPDRIETQTDQERPCRKDMRKEPLAVVDGHSRTEKYQKGHDRAGQQQRKRIGTAIFPGPSESNAPEKLQSERHSHREVKPWIMPRHVVIRKHLAEVLHHDRLPYHAC